MLRQADALRAGTLAGDRQIGLQRRQLLDVGGSMSAEISSATAVHSLSGTGQLSLSAERVLDYVVSAATDEITKQAIEREQRRFRVVTLLVSIVGFVGIGTFAWMLNVTIHKAADDAVKSPIVLLEKRLDFEIAYQQFIGLALSMDKQESFSRNERDSVMDLLRRIAASEYYNARPGFHSYLNRVVQALFAAGMQHDVSEIDRLFRPALGRNPEIVISMVTHYGQMILGSALPLSRLQDEVLALEHYARIAKTENLPELYILWNLMLEFARNDFVANPTTNALAASVASLSDPDRRSLERHVYLMSDPTRYMAEVTDDGSRLGERFRKAVAQHPQLGANVQSADGDADANDAAALEELVEQLRRSSGSSEGER